MSFPPPIIPQTAEQAVQRDTIAGLRAVQPTDPAVELARLQAAVREHRDTVEVAGPLGFCAECFDENRERTEAKHAADTALWAHLGDA